MTSVSINLYLSVSPGTAEGIGFYKPDATEIGKVEPIHLTRVPLKYVTSYREDIGSPEEQFRLETARDYTRTLG